MICFVIILSAETQIGLLFYLRPQTLDLNPNLSCFSLSSFHPVIDFLSQHSTAQKSHLSVVFTSPVNAEKVT